MTFSVEFNYLIKTESKNIYDTCMSKGDLINE